MEGIALFVSIVIIVFGILQIILFFKIWGMTNNVSELKKIYDQKSERLILAINRIVEETQKENLKVEKKKDERKDVVQEKKEEELDSTHKDSSKKGLSVTEENSNDFKQHLLKWEMLKKKGCVEQAIQEYMEYTQLDRNFAEDFISNL